MYGSDTLQKLDEELGELGFSPGWRVGEFRNGKMVLRIEDGWLEATLTEKPRKLDPLVPVRPYLGLWRPKRDAKSPKRFSQRWGLPFDLIAGQIVDDALYGEDEQIVSKCVTWAKATAVGKTPKNGGLPAGAELAKWLPKESLTIRAGTMIRVGKIEVGGNGHLVVRYPVVVPVPDEMPDLRLRWLRRVFSDAQEGQGLCRFREEKEDGKVGIWAEVDLSGVPEALAEDLLRRANEDLHWLVGKKVLPLVEVLINGNGSIRLLEAMDKLTKTGRR